MIIILRLNHRIARDPRLSTHVALTARAFLADKLFYSGQKDSNLEFSVKKVNEKFGSNFEIEYLLDPIKFLNQNKDKFTVVHLTVYGVSIKNKVNELKKKKNLIIIIGGEKVEPIYYELADYNISITHEPISEVSALALFLHLLNNGKELENKFNGKLRILDSERRKKIAKL